MTTKAELEEQAKEQGYETEGLSKAELEALLKDKSGVGMEGQSSPYYPQLRRHQNASEA
jgi:hypothetical protein